MRCLVWSLFRGTTWYGHGALVMDVVSVNYIGKSGCLFLIFVTCGFVISRGFFSKQEPTAIPLAAQIPSNPNQTTSERLCGGESYEAETAVAASDNQLLGYIIHSCLGYL